MNKKQKRTVARIITALVLLILLIILEKTGNLSFLDGRWYAFVPFLLPYLLAGYDVILKAAKNIAHGQVFDENFLMMIATFGAFFVGEYAEASGVMIFYQIGELFQGIAVGKSRRSIAALMDISPEYANIERDGELVEVDPDEVHPGDLIVIKPGERIPLDGTVVDGSSMIDTSSLTGESVPRSAREGDPVISGCINGSGTLRVQVSREYEDSTVAKILELTENASSRKSPIENFITRFAKIYTPAVTIAAVLLAVIPPLLFGQDWMEWIKRACTFLVISCPCALVISVPLGFFGGIGASSRIGVLVKGSNFLEALSQVKTIVFDKTGTLTKGEFRVQKLYPAEGVSEAELLRKAALAETYSTHPIAEALRAAQRERLSEKAARTADQDAPGTGDSGRSEADDYFVTDAQEIAGKGLSVLIDGKPVLAGNAALLRDAGVDFSETEDAGTVVYLAEDGRFLGSAVISDSVKEGAKEALESLKKSGVRETVMLSGDRRKAAETVGAELSIDSVYSELLPQDKVTKLEEILRSGTGKDKTAYVGDGINDAPVLSRADLGIAMGSLGSDAAVEAADIVLMDDDVTKIAETMKIAQKTLRIVRENIWFALGVKFAVLILGAFGLASMWLATFADVGVAVIAILNSMRMLRRKAG